MHQIPLIPHVSDTWGGLVKVRDPRGILTRQLEELGFKRFESGDFFQTSAATPEAQANIFDALRNLGVAFVHGSRTPESPASLFLELCEKGLLSGTFAGIYWYGPKKYVVEEIEGPLPPASLLHNPS